jgi:hypothetical protein
VKMDIEGFEFELFDNIINSRFAIERFMLEIHYHSPEEWIEVFGKLIHSGFKISHNTKRAYFPGGRVYNQTEMAKQRPRGLGEYSFFRLFDR